MFVGEGIRVRFDGFGRLDDVVKGVVAAEGSGGEEAKLIFKFSILSVQFIICGKNIQIVLFKIWVWFINYGQFVAFD